MVWFFIVIATLSGVALLSAAGYGLYRTFRPVRILQEETPPPAATPPAAQPQEPIEIPVQQTQSYRDGAWTVTTTTYTTNDPNAVPPPGLSASRQAGFDNLARTLTDLFREDIRVPRPPAPPSPPRPRAAPRPTPPAPPVRRRSWMERLKDDDPLCPTTTSETPKPPSTK